jgi:hypothetical protein
VFVSVAVPVSRNSLDVRVSWRLNLITLGQAKPSLDQRNSKIGAKKHMACRMENRPEALSTRKGGKILAGVTAAVAARAAGHEEVPACAVEDMVLPEEATGHSRTTRDEQAPESVNKWWRTIEIAN